MPEATLQNWKRDITYRPHVVVFAESVGDIVRIVQDRERFPAPIRAKGSHHSTTDCLVADGGTVVDLTRMNKIVSIDKEVKTVTTQAGVLHIDLAHELEKHGLQLYVNCEIGNLTYGSAACCATKDASFHTAAEGWEFGQVASYCVGVKAVGADGALFEVTEEDGELMQAMRSSYGMLGIIYEVTFRVKELAPMAMEHVVYHVDEFAGRLDELIDGNRSMMLYLDPFLNRVIVEYRWTGSGPVKLGAWQWKLRNLIWSVFAPAYGKIITSYVPSAPLKSFCINLWSWILVVLGPLLLRGENTSPADQIVRYPPTAGLSAYTFSIWAFPRADYAKAIRDYFKFVRDYYAKTGFRTDLLHVGYHVTQDRQSLFSYTRDSAMLTLDPVATGGPGWHEFLVSYNAFCSAHAGKPLFNQSPHLTPEQARAAFANEIETFQSYRRKYDLQNRFYTPFFKELFEGA